MAKESFYFRHDYNARNDDKILELRSRFGGEGYGVFWMIIETMAENEGGGIKASLIGGLSHGYGVAKGWLNDFLTECVNIGLLYEESGTYYSKRLLTHKEFRKFLSQKGADGAKKRCGGYSPPNTTPNAKERKEKEIENTKEERNIKDVVGTEKQTNDSFFYFFRRAAGSHISDTELRQEVGKFRNKYPNVHANQSGALINAWVSNIGKEKTTEKKMVL